jgi:diacylglycerol kinase (ATP)
MPPVLPTIQKIHQSAGVLWTRQAPQKQNHLPVRICVIFNPAARGNKARHFQRWLDTLATEAALKPTACAGDARRLAAEAVRENFDTVIAAGGDGTVNEVLNGIGDAPDGFFRARLGVLPLGTVNVFARELKIPAKIPQAWEMVRGGREMLIDLPRVDFIADGKPARRYFGQLAGAGLDARAIELVSWRLKKKAGPLAYVIAGFQALAERQPKITVRAEGKILSGELVLAGNGRLYGGQFEIFPEADYTDGRIEICVFPRLNVWTLVRFAPAFLLRHRLPEHSVNRLRAAVIELDSEPAAAFELDGEWVGQLPATFSIEPKKLRVVVP